MQRRRQWWLPKACLLAIAASFSAASASELSLSQTHSRSLQLGLPALRCNVWLGHISTGSIERRPAVSLYPGNQSTLSLVGVTCPALTECNSLLQLGEYCLPCALGKWCPEGTTNPLGLLNINFCPDGCDAEHTSPHGSAMHTGVQSNANDAFSCATHLTDARLTLAFALLSGTLAHDLTRLKGASRDGIVHARHGMAATRAPK